MIPREVFEQSVLGFLEPIRPFLEDPTVTEVMINGPFQIFIERAGHIYKTDAQFKNMEALQAAIRNLAQFVGRHIDEERPILEARLPDGSRVEAIIPPVAPDGPNLAIRRFFRETLTIEKLINLGSITPDGADLLRILVAAKQNIIVAGGTGSGKTSLLNVLSGFCGDSERIITIEDSRELQLQKPHVVHLESRPPDPRGRGAITIRDLFKATLRMRPDRIVVGELRSGEAIDLIQAMTSGHGGCLTTVHATYPKDTMTRLETLALMSDIELPLVALRAQISSAIDVIVQTSRQADGSRCITHISQVVSHDPTHGYQMEDMFVRHPRGRDAAGRVLSEFLPTGRFPRNFDMIRGNGLDVPRSMYDAYARLSGSHVQGGQASG